MHKLMNWSLVAQRTICSATQFAGDTCDSLPKYEWSSTATSMWNVQADHKP